MKSNRHDIETEGDVKLMVDSFYDKVNKDELLSYVFNDFSKVDWETHLPKMYSFWNTLIFGKQSYKGFPFGVHTTLPIHKTHFDRWVQLFDENIDDLFEGEVAIATKQRAKSIASTFQAKLEFINNSNK
ncbi:MAG: sec-independent protein translocase TatC [Flavobacterium sp. MedPE-SWcel]|uniref:group III truncated hemoglobin n=1 Tax=uncultured Flavobacterium sp. TaxID=165435 RepID=UPI00091BD79E|nr:group III truncated hemoglobin [uncultured Flavobacterium sp.]OIQ18093.1 MAG: sec-independent protein translocase TatC [Flavobacterium sp. MedPE-SWcel]